MCSQHLARGFSTWLEAHQTHTHRRRLLLHASASLGKPGLLAAFSWFAHFGSYFRFYSRFLRLFFSPPAPSSPLVYHAVL